MALITCQDVSLGYEGNTAVSELNFEVLSGDYLCIVGENGSGKSTLIKGLLKLIKPLSGNILISDGLKRTEIGYLPQQTPAQKDFPASAYEVILSGRLNSRGLLPFYSKKDRAIVEENIKRLKILDLKSRCYRELSGGQQQRVLLCRALCATKKLLLLDEPASGLDPIVTGELYKIIKTINKEMSLTIIMISHDIKSAVKYADKILHLENKQSFFGLSKDWENSKIGKKFIGEDNNDDY